MRSKHSLRSLVTVIFVTGFILVAFAQAASPAAPVKAAQSMAAPQITWPQISLKKVVGGLENPTYITLAGDNSGRLFVVEQRGRILIVKNGAVSATFLDITNQVKSPFSGGGGEEGLLSVAFPPSYASQGVFYVYFTNKNGDNQVSRFQVTGDPDAADPNSEALVLLIPHPDAFTNHNGGQLAFGPDGYLYIGSGDGGGAGDPQKNGQNPGTLLGKLLRIDVNPGVRSKAPTAYQLFFPLIFNSRGGTPETAPYQIPADNPFLGTPGALGEIWAIGLRNPWRFSFDRTTGDLYIADVGQNLIEEVDFQPAGSKGGENYGWNILEGTSCYSPSSGCVPPPHYVPPVAEYQHGADGCSISGGYVYRGPGFPSLQGIYFYGDYCSGKVWGLQRDGSAWASQELTGSSYSISSFGEDQAGELYLADLGGAIYQVTAIAP